MTVRLGAIDVGTNSVRYLVADVDGSSLEGVERDLVITRLGEGVDRAGRLTAAPLERTVEAIARYRERCTAAGATSVVIAATSAVRDAANRDEFFAAVRAAAGQDAEVLSGEREANASFRGATAGLPPDGGPYLVLDIGGGSTELVVGNAREGVRRWISLDVGSVRLTERHVRSDPIAPAEIKAVEIAGEEAVTTALGAVGREARTLVGLAGTITTLAAIHLGLDGYDRDAVHHSVLSHARVAELGGMLAAMRVAERRRLPVMPPGREDVIVAGAILLERVMRGFGFDEVLVSESDILDGLVLLLAERLSPGAKAARFAGFDRA